MVAGIGDVYIALSIDGDAPRHIELTGAATIGAPFREQLALRRQLLDSVIAGVDYIKVALGV